MDSISKVFTRVLLSDYIKLHPRYLSKDIDVIITEKLKEKVEGKCTKHGYIKKDSIDIYKIAPGKIELVGLNGFVQYLVYFYADVCNPLVGSIIKCNVVNINKFGILGEAGFYSNADFVNVLEIIIAKNSINIVSEVDLENVKIGDEVFVEVLGKKYELGSQKISVIGRVVKGYDVQKKGKKDTKKEIKEEEEEEEPEEVGVDVEGEAEAEAEAEEEEEEEVEEEDEEEDEKSSKGGAFFSDNDSVEEEYEMYGSDMSGSGSGSEAEEDI